MIGLFFISSFLNSISTECFAQLSAAEKTARHRDLYNEAERLMGQKQYGEACPKLEQAIELERRYGTLYLLGDCYENTGKIASAWALFAEVADITAGNPALADGHQQAVTRAASLEPRVPRLTISVPEPVAKIDGLVVKFGKSTLDPKSWGSSIPVDPGETIIETSAPERGTGTLSVTIAEGEKKSIEVPEPPEKFNYFRWGSFAAGAAGFGVGAGFGVLALSKWDEAKQKCGGNPAVCGKNQTEFDEAQSLRSSANTFAWVSNAGLALGIAGTAMFVYSLVAKPSPSPTNSSMTFIPVINPKELSGTVRFTF